MNAGLIDEARSQRSHTQTDRSDERRTMPSPGWATRETLPDAPQAAISNVVCPSSGAKGTRGLRPNYGGRD